VRKEFEDLLEQARELEREQVPEFLGLLETVRVTALARLSVPIEVKADELLTVDECRKRLKVSAAYLYRNSARLPFTRHEGTRLLFSAAGLEKYLKGKAR
jgi:hypothetical protein